MITLKDLNPNVLRAEYAVRGPIVERAQKLEAQGRKIIYCNIGNPQALEQKPLTYLRQVLALCQYPDLIERGADLFPADVRDTARRILEGTRYGLGAYSDSKGVRFVRDAVAAFISERDGIEADPEAVYLTYAQDRLASYGIQPATLQEVFKARNVALPGGLMLEAGCSTERNRNEIEGGMRGYKEINLRAMKLLNPGGCLVTCSCSYHLTENIFIDVIGSAAAAF